MVSSQAKKPHPKETHFHTDMRMHARETKKIKDETFCTKTQTEVMREYNFSTTGGRQRDAGPIDRRSREVALPGHDQHM